MKICKIDIKNFRGIKNASILLDGNAVFVGDNNCGKSTIFEAIDLVMGPERLSRSPVINEYDFYAGEYLDKEGKPVEIRIDIIVTHLTPEQKRLFHNHIKWWNNSNHQLIERLEETDEDEVDSALHFRFIGKYDSDEDDFCGQTTFVDMNSCDSFSAKDKRKCGFLYLRTLRTGSRALSLEKGSLLDIILQLDDNRLKIWESILTQLRDLSVMEDSKLGINNILSSFQNSLSSIITSEDANKPQFKISNLTRENLKKILTVFLDSGVYCENGKRFSVPYYHQGTGTINILVLSLLSMIAEKKDNVIFAMEEPETAIPPHIQKRVVKIVIDKSTQALFTSHSPYVLEEFNPKEILVVSNNNGDLNAISAGMPPAVKPKAYREEFRKRFCESLLSKRVLITEGRTEYDVYSVASDKLQTCYPDKHYSFDLLGISLVNAETETQIAQLGKYYKSLNKKVYAVFDNQTPKNLEEIKSNVDYPFEATEKGIENVVLNNVDCKVLLSYGLKLISDGLWPSHLDKKPQEDMSADDLKKVLLDYFRWGKGSSLLANFIEYCSEKDLPGFIKNTIIEISKTLYPEETTAMSKQNEGISTDFGLF